MFVFFSPLFFASSFFAQRLIPCQEEESTRGWEEGEGMLATSPKALVFEKSL